MEDLGLPGRASAGAGRRNGSFKSSSKWKTISNYWKSIAENATTSVASAVRSVGSSSASSSSGVEEEQQREQVLWAGFEMLELGESNAIHVLLLAYLNGFQVWDIESAKNVRELVSRRDGPVSYLRLQPQPCTQESREGSFKAARPLLLVISGEASSNVASIPGGYNVGSEATHLGSFTSSLPTSIRFYSLQTHQYVHTLRFGAGIHGVRCSPRVVAVAFMAQIYCYDADTLQSIFSVLTYPNLQGVPGGGSQGFGAVAVGPRWLAYAANQPLVSCTGRASPQHLTPSPGVSPSTSPANGNMVAYYAKESSKQIAAGIITLGDRGYKTLSRYCSDILPDGSGSPGSGSPRWKSNNVSVLDPENAGTVIVRDFVSKAVVAQFRAHMSPLSALCFDQSGTLLVTASVHGHNLNVFLLMPQLPANTKMPMAYDGTMSFVHLYKLYRGITNAVIQDIVFSSDSRRICVSSSRGTCHLFAISPFGGSVGHLTHGGMAVNGIARSKVAPRPVIPWWSNYGPVKVAQEAFSPPPTLGLSAVNRIRNGPAGWRGTVSGAAAAATGRASSSGAIAAVFHDGSDYASEFQFSDDALRDKVWVLCPSGHLVRYLLLPSIGGQLDVSESATKAGSLDFDSEPLEKWDVCRQSNWNEREERLHLLGCRSLEVDEVLPEDRQRLYMSKAEIQMQQARPFPIWAKPNISFEILLLDGKDLSIHQGECGGGEVEIEKVSTHVIEVRRKDLTPLVENFKSHDLRILHRKTVAENLTHSISSRPEEHIMHDEFAERHFGQEVESVSRNNLYIDGFAHKDEALQAQTHVASCTTDSPQQHFPVSDLEDHSPPLRALGSVSKYVHQTETLVDGCQKHKDKISKLHAVLESKSSSRLIKLDYLHPDYCSISDHFAHGSASTMVGNESKEAYFQLRDKSIENVKTINADMKTVDADCRSILTNIRHDPRSVQDNSHAITSETLPTYGSLDAHVFDRFDYQESLTGQSTQRVKEHEKVLSVAQVLAVTAYQEPDQRSGYQLDAESTQEYSKNVLKGMKKLKCNDSLEDADGSDSCSQQDENLGENGGEVWDGAMFPFNDEGT